MNRLADVSVVLADFQFLTRTAMRLLIEELPGFQLITQIDKAEDLKGKIASIKPDLLIVDIFEDNPDYLDPIKEVQEEYDLRVLIITNTQNNIIIQSLLNAGIKGIVSKNCGESEIINAIKAVAIGNRFYCNSILDLVVENNIDQEERNKCTNLTPRELQVLKLIAAGNKTQEIADTLYISVHTVNSHRKNILRKLNLNSPIHLVTYAMESGLIQVNYSKRK